MMQLMRPALAWITELSVPLRCAGCEAHGHAICDECAIAFASNGPVTRSARGGSPPVIALGPYSGRLARAIRSLKFGGRRRAAHLLGALLAAMIGVPVDVVVAVPLHRARLRDRGFNQAHLLAASVAAGRVAPLIAHALTRVVNTTSQSILSLDDRQSNVQSAFAPGDDAEMLEDRRVLI